MITADEAKANVAKAKGELDVIFNQIDELVRRESTAGNSITEVSASRHLSGVIMDELKEKGFHTNRMFDERKPVNVLIVISWGDLAF